MNEAQRGVLIDSKQTMRWYVIAAIIAVELLVLAGLAFAARTAPDSAVMVRADQVGISVADQRVFDAVAVDRVLIPTDGWVVVRTIRDGKPAEVIGYAPVEAGETSPVMVKLNQQRGVPREALVILYADRATRGVFEFNGPMLVTDTGGGMAMAMGGATNVEETGTAEAEAAGGMAALEDKPLYAGRELVAKTVELARFSVGVQPGQAVLDGASADEAGTAVTVARVVAPGPSWIAVSEAGTGPGGTGKVLKVVPFSPGTKRDVTIRLKKPAGQTPLVVSLHADLGQRGTFEFDPRPDKNDKIDIIDKMYFMDLTMISLGVARVAPLTAPAQMPLGSGSTVPTAP